MAHSQPSPPVRDSDLKRLMQACEAVRMLPSAVLPDEYFYASLPLCVLDAVFSIGTQYRAVQNVIDRYCKAFARPQFRSRGPDLPHPSEQHTITEFLDRVEPSGPDALAKILGNRQRTSTQSGILKADAAVRFGRVLRDHGVDVLQDVPSVLHESTFKQGIRKIPGQRSGVSLAYFFMLAGSDDLIKPDRMVQRFVTRVLGRDSGPVDTLALLRAACTQLKMAHPTLTPRLLDYIIWSEERSRLPVRAPKSRGARAAEDSVLWDTDDLEIDPIGEEPDGSEDPDAIVLDDALDGWADYLHRKAQKG